MLEIDPCTATSLREHSTQLRSRSTISETVYVDDTESLLMKAPTATRWTLLRSLVSISRSFLVSRRRRRGKFPSQFAPSRNERPAAGFLDEATECLHAELHFARVCVLTNRPALRSLPPIRPFVRPSTLFSVSGKNLSRRHQEGQSNVFRVPLPLAVFGDSVAATIYLTVSPN